MPTIYRAVCKKLRFVLLIAACVLMAGFGAESAKADGITLYVAPNGSDTAPGTKKAPLATLTGARNALRKLRQQNTLPKGGAVVEVAGGTYALSEPLELTEADAGTAESPIVYRAARGQAARLTGGRTVTNFAPVTDPQVMAQLDPAARNKIVQADLKAQNLADYGAMTPRGFSRPLRQAGMEVFFDDRPLPLARWPNTGFVHVSKVVSLTNRQIASIEIPAARVEKWKTEPDLWAFGYYFHDWADSYDKIAAVDPAASSLTFAAPGSGYGYRIGQRFFLLNALSELDAPGEWYIDREKGILYLYPPAPLKSNSVVVSVTLSLLNLKNTAYTTFRGFILEACRGDAVSLRGGQNNRIVACTLRNIGNRAVVVDEGETESGVAGCDISETGDGGIVLSGGDRKTLTPAHLFAENNQIHDYSRWCRTYRPGVSVAGVGNRVAHNLIYDGPHNAIQLSGNDHLIEYNEIHNVCYETGDVGAFYMGRDWTARGTIIRNNYFHHISGPGHIGAMGVYLDDQASGITISSNIFSQVTRAVFIGGGDDNTVENNLFVDCVPAVHLDARGLGWQKKATDDPKDTLHKNYDAVPVTSDLWRAKYPTLLPHVAGTQTPGAPEGNTVLHNVSLGGRWSDVEAAAQPGIVFTANFTEGDPGLVNAAKNDFRLKPGFPALGSGFQPIDFARIGLQNGPDRVSWPVSHPVKSAAASEATPVAATNTVGPFVVVSLPKGIAPMLDGVLSPGEWNSSRILVLEQGVEREAVAPPSRVFAHVSGGNLFVAFENQVENALPIRLGKTWGQDDAVEVALQLTPNAPTYVLRGFAGGTFVSSPEAGAANADAARIGSAVTYAAKVVSPTLWTAELKIPLSALGINMAKGGQIAVNFTVRKSAGRHGFYGVERVARRGASYRQALLFCPPRSGALFLFRGQIRGVLFAQGVGSLLPPGRF